MTSRRQQKLRAEDYTIHGQMTTKTSQTDGHTNQKQKATQNKSRPQKSPGDGYANHEEG